MDYVELYFFRQLGGVQQVFLEMNDFCEEPSPLVTTDSSLVLEAHYNKKKKTNTKNKKVRSCAHKTNRYQCAVCYPCAHGKTRSMCKICNDCGHGKLKQNCNVCSGCVHGKIRLQCRFCNPCEHNKGKYTCLQCKEKRKQNIV